MYTFRVSIAHASSFVFASVICLWLVDLSVLCLLSMYTAWRDEIIGFRRIQLSFQMRGTLANEELWSSPKCPIERKIWIQGAWMIVSYVSSSRTIRRSWLCDHKFGMHACVGNADSTIKHYTSLRTGYSHAPAPRSRSKNIMTAKTHNLLPYNISLIPRCWYKHASWNISFFPFFLEYKLHEAKYLWARFWEAYCTLKKGWGNTVRCLRQDSEQSPH